MPVMPIHPHHSDNTLFSLVILRQRYFLVSIIFFLIGYILFVHKHFFYKPIRIVPIIVALLAGCIIISIFHQNRLDQHYIFKQKIYEATVDNALIISDDRPEKFIQDSFGKRKVLNVEIISDVTVIFRKIEAYPFKDVYLFITRSSEDEHSKQMLKLVLDQYPSKMVSQFNNFTIYRLII
jgi:hypothetical protein